MISCLVRQNPMQGRVLYQRNIYLHFLLPLLRERNMFEILKKRLQRGGFYIRQCGQLTPLNKNSFIFILNYNKFLFEWR